jgi:hypothetical protein
MKGGRQAGMLEKRPYSTEEILEINDRRAPRLQDNRYSTDIIAQRTDNRQTDIFNRQTKFCR